MAKICGRCKQEKQPEEFYRNKQGKDGRHSVCKECRRISNKSWRHENAEHVREERNKYNLRNRDRINHRCRRRHKENPYIKQATDHRTRARKVGLPAEITAVELEEIFKRFNYKCPLTGETNIEADHFIALSTKKGPGSTVQNIVPMSKKINERKSFLNPFEWFSENKDEFELNEINFSKLIEYLAQLNNMSITEYRDFVYKCYDQQ